MKWEIIPRRKIYTLDTEIKELAAFIFKKKREPVNWIPKFEREFAYFAGVKHAIALPSGRKGFQFILEALELNRGSEVIIPAYTFGDLIDAIHSSGLAAVPADINNQTFNIDPESIIKKITNRTKVILATHLFGAPCRIDKILEIARRDSIFVIEDCAHSIGAKFKGVKTGSFGDAAFFSFDTIKLVNTYGGGMVVTNNEELANKIRAKLTRFGKKQKLPIMEIISAILERKLFSTPMVYPFLSLLASSYWNKITYSCYRKTQGLSPKYPFTDFQAYIGFEKLKTLNSRISLRQEQVDFYKPLMNKKFIPQKIDDNTSSNYYYFVVLAPSNIERIRKFLLASGIDAGIGPEIADDCAAILGYQDCPNAKKVFQQAIQLPLYEGLTQNAISSIINVLNGAIFD